MGRVERNFTGIYNYRRLRGRSNREKSELDEGLLLKTKIPLEHCGPFHFDDESN